MRLREATATSSFLDEKPRLACAWTGVVGGGGGGGDGRFAEEENNRPDWDERLRR